MTAPSITATALDPLVDLIVARVFDLVRAELARGPSLAPERLIRADATGLGKTPRASARAVHRLASCGRLPASKLGKYLFVRDADLAAFIEARRVAPTPVVAVPSNDCAPGPAPGSIDAFAEEAADELGLVPVKAPLQRRRVVR